MAGTSDTLQVLESTVADLFGNWQDRLRETCEMTSPDGDTFSPLWDRSPRSFVKKLGIFTFPKVRGTYIQDLEASGDIYPMPLFFDGPDNDKEARRFFTACKQKGKWIVVHPVHGDLELQLSKAEEMNDPTGSGNVTAVICEFMESIELVFTPSDAATLTEAQAFLVNSAAALQYAENFIDDSFSAIQGAINAAKTAQVLIGAALDPLFTISSEINNAFNSINSAITDTLDAAILDPLKLAGQFQQLIRLPVSATTNIQARLDAYQAVYDGIFLTPQRNTNDESKNTVLTQELLLSSVLVAVAQTAATSVLTNRPEAIESNEIISNQFISVTNFLDDAQVVFQDVPIDKQYFSQSLTYHEVAKIVGLSIGYLNALIFTLAVERRFVLDRYRTSFDITVTEYGSTGEDDSNIVFFEESNKLKGDEFLVLPPGREVVVYG